MQFSITIVNIRIILNSFAQIFCGIATTFYSISSMMSEHGALGDKNISEKQYFGDLFVPIFGKVLEVGDLVPVRW